MRGLASAMTMLYLSFSSCFFLCSCVGFYTRLSPGTAALLDSQGHSIQDGYAQYDKASPDGLSVQEASAMAINNNIELKAEAESLELREGAWKLGVRSYLPAIELGTSNDERLSLYAPDTFNKSVSLSLSQPLWDGGRLATARTLERAEISLLQLEHDRKRRAAGEEAISAYRSVVAAQARLQIKRRSLESAGGERAVLAAEIDLGLAKAMDMILVDLRISGMEIALYTAELELAQTEEVLAEVLGIAVLPPLLDGISLSMCPVKLESECIGYMAVERSPLLEQARQKIISRSAEVRAACYSWFPTIGFKADAHVSGSHFPLSRLSWSLGINLDFSSPFISGGIGSNRGSQPPFDTTARSTVMIRPCSDIGKTLDSKAARLALKLEEERYRSLCLDIRRKAEAAVSGYVNASLKRDIAIRALNVSQSMSELVAAQIRLGQALRSDAIHAELERSEKEIDLIDAMSSLVAAERKIEMLLDIPPGSLSLFIGSMAGGGS